MVNNLSVDLDRVFHAIADGTRRAILVQLTRGDSTVTALAEPFAMSLPAISKHLRVLENAGLLRRTKDGRVHRIGLDAAPLKDASNWIERYREFWQQAFDALDAHLKEHS